MGAISGQSDTKIDITLVGIQDGSQTLWNMLINDCLATLR